MKLIQSLLMLCLPVIVAAQTRTLNISGPSQVYAGQSFRVIVDYAHTDDALQKLLQSAREITSRKLIVIFGCGGDRDRTKRPLMGEAAGRGADHVVVTSDNPRSEDPAAIIREIEDGLKRTGAPYDVVPDRREKYQPMATRMAKYKPITDRSRKLRRPMQRDPPVV